MSSSLRPYSIIIFVNRKSNISPEQFKDHWENTHVPLLQSLAGPRFPLSHIRHYLARDSANSTYPLNLLVGKPQDINFDAFAVVTFASEEAFRDFIPTMSLPEVAEDEDRFTDREKMRAVVLGYRNETGGT
ncbi:EthD domain-containing protein [Triangularia setosa]|uniref:EthD domain-containing protein n=1 Tax=Triangularia setosa TaxID=2587417 RepID=A0AAN6W4Q6_9PEZI|nr:EthD domain-containing protein [Podospora setosa]